MLRKYRMDDRGATAIEFALIALPFFFTLFVVFETGWIATQKALVDGAIEHASREIYLGRAKDQNLTGADIEKLICDQSKLVPDCTSNTLIEMRVVNNFNSFPKSTAACKDKDLPINPNVVYQNGDESEIMFMRVCVRIPVLSSLGAELLGLKRSSTGKYSIVSQIAFVNRRYSS